MARTTAVAKERTVLVDWSEIKQAFMQRMESGEWVSQPTLDNKFRGWKREPYKRDQFCGDSAANMLSYLREGFHAPEFLVTPEHVMIGKRKRARWNEEEGDIDLGRLAGGHDEVFLGMEERPSRPGLRVVAEYCFAALSQDTLIKEYCAWLASFIGALESQGFDLTVDLFIPVSSLFKRENIGTRTNILIRVKRPQEISDFTEWSALFSPAGFRMLGFTALAIAGDKLGKTCTSSLGNTIASNWGVVYEREQALVRVNVDQQSYAKTLPEERLTGPAREAGLLA